MSKENKQLKEKPNLHLTIELPEKRKVKAYGGKEVEIDKIEIHEIRDSNVKKEVVALCRNHPTRIILWEGDAYDAIGQWTNDDVVARVNELAKTF